jgi:hypothetical protein
MRRPCVLLLLLGCCFYMEGQKYPLRNTMRAAREAVLLFSEKSVSKCLMFFK